MSDLMRGVRGRNQELGGHAPDAGARGSVRTVFNEDPSLIGFFCFATGVEAGGAGTDDGDVGRDALHSAFG